MSPVDEYVARAAPLRESYHETLAGLEQRWAAEISDLVARVAGAIYPLPVSSTWIDRISQPGHPLTDAHFRRVQRLDAHHQTDCAIIRRELGLCD